MIKKRYFIAFLSILSLQGYSQKKHACKASEQNEIYFQKHPESRQEYKSFNTFTKNKAASNLQAKTLAGAYTIPVVFHVYGTTQNGQTITTEKIQVALQKLNEDFQGLNADFNDVDPYFSNIKSSLDIEFKLAKLDPNGNCTSGVVYYDEQSGYGNGGGYDTQISNDAWDNYKYMNVYIQADLYADGSTTNSGVAWYPNTSMSDNNTARVVYNGAYLHGNTGNEFASVLTHEFGHYLNLIHTFEGGCTYPNDQVADTPAENESVVGANCAPITNCEGNFINYENYMGYNGAADGCYRMFTQGQIDRMVTALQHPARITLWQAQNLIDTGVNNSGASFSIANNIFKESIDNNGAINQTATITVNGASFANANTILTPGVDYTLSVPQGLSAMVQTTSSTTANITISGTAANHAMANNATLNLDFNGSVLGTSQNLSCSSVSLKLNFYDPFKIIYENIADISASPSSTWQFFSLPQISGDGSYGAWSYASNHLKLETYGKKLITNTNSRNIALLTTGQLIETTSNFTAPGAYPDQLDLRTASHTTWDGKTGYVGFLSSHNNEPIHGWMKVNVSNNGNTMTITEYAFYTKPNGTIKAGQTVLDNTPITVNAPSNLISVADSSSAISLNWSDNATNETGFTIERATTNGNYVAIATTTANISSYIDTGLTPETIYSYRVRAFSGDTNSDYSNTTTATTQTQQITVNAPSNLISVADSSSAISLNWTDNATNETGFTIERATTNGNYVAIASTTANTSTYTDTGLIPETTYSYRVRAFSGDTNSDYSNTTTTTTKTDVVDTYCTITANNTYEFINTVTIGDFTNTSVADTNGYADYTAKTINISAGATTNVSLTPGFSGSAYTEHWAIYIDYNKDMIFDASERVLDGLSGNGVVTGSFTAMGNLEQTTRMRVVMKYNASPVDACSAVGDGEVEDYTVRITTGGTIEVMAPTNLVATVDSSSQITLNWQDNATNEQGFKIERAENNGTYTLISSPTANTTTYIDNSVIQGTTYSYRVRAYLDNTESVNSNQATATTSVEPSYCSISGNNAYEYIQSVGFNSFTNASLADTNGYADYTAKTINVAASSSVNVSLTPGFSSSAYTEHWVIYIDYNNNGVFDASERVLDGLSGTSAVTGSFTVASIAPTTTTMRVIMKYNSAATDACSAIGDGEAEDYTIIIGEPNTTPTLEVPTNISSAGTYSTGFYAAWNTITDATTYEVQLLNNGVWQTQGTSSTYYLWIPKQGTQTNYTFRVRAKNATENSIWSNSLDISLPLSGPRQQEPSIVDVRVYPNPATDFVTVTASNKEQLSTTIFNVQGKEVGYFKGQSTISVQHLPKGIYVLRINTTNKQVIKKLIVK